MSKIPYTFDTPVPKYFRESGWFSNPNAILFVTWAFSKCSHETRTTVHDGKEITLEPYEFITGRSSSSSDCFLTVEAFRHQLNTFLKAGLLKNTPNSTPNRFTCYKWLTERFCKPNPQLNPHEAPNKPPTEPPQSRNKNTSSIEEVNKEKAQPAKRLHSKDFLTFNFEKWEFEGISEKDISDWIQLYPHIDIKIEMLRAINWLKSNPSKSRKSQWRKFITGWFQRSNESASNKKAYQQAANPNSNDRRTKDKSGIPVPNQYEGRF